jgi:hypothetical protein
MKYVSNKKEDALWYLLIDIISVIYKILWIIIYDSSSTF